MKKILLLLLAAVVAGVALYKFSPAPEVAVSELEEGYGYLYDGKSLDGWHVIGGEATFTAEGDDIVGRHGPGKNSFLRTDKTYADFSLKMQMRWDEPGNSGVMFRAGQRMHNGRAFGYQYELDPSERAWTGGLYDEARRGWLVSLEENEVARQALHLDDWNDIEIEARGPRLKTWINGVLAVDTLDGLDAQGYIALQVHAGNAGVIRWRNIRIKEFEAQQQSVQRTTANDWRVANIAHFASADGNLRGQLSGPRGVMSLRRHLDDALVRMTVPACDSPTVVRMRSNSRESIAESFVEVRIFEDRVEGTLVTSEGEVALKPVPLKKAAQHDLLGISMGGAITITVDDRDVLRLRESALPARGQLWVQPAACKDEFQIANFVWHSLAEQNSEVLFYQTLGSAPAPVLSPEEALASFRIAPGFSIELVASEPLVEDPVAMAWDEFGRLYVVELRGYMLDAYGTGSEAPVGRVVRLEDVDGDGKMDSSAVYLDKLVNPRAVAVVNEGVLIGEPPNLWLCATATREALCGNKIRVGDYASDVGAANVEHMENGLLSGLDNWLYNAKSSRRMRLENGKMQAEEGLFRGQWGISKDNYGRLFYNHNSTWLQADLFTAEDLVSPGVEEKHSGLGVNLTPNSEVFSVRVNPGVNRAYLDGTLREDGRLNKATGVSGLAVYRGDQFPTQYQNDVFVPEAAGNVVAQFELQEQGVKLIAKQRLYNDETWGQRDFLGSTDERFRPVDASNGPDGALYIIDMYRGIVQDDYFLTDELREQIFQRELDTPLGMGRIWRVRHNDGNAQRGLQSLAGMTDVQLVEALASPNGWVRDTAQRLLLASKGSVKPLLTKTSVGSHSLAAIHAIWALQGREELDRQLVLALALGVDAHRQIQVLRAGREALQSTDMASLYEALAKGSQAVRIQLALVMGDHAAEKDVRDQLRELLLAEQGSVYLREAVLRAVRGVELEFMTELLADGRIDRRKQPSVALLKSLSAQAYRNLRGDLSSDDAANVRLLDLLALAESRKGALAWQQIAILRGFKRLTMEDGFVPAVLAAAPPIFSNGSIKEKNPLWEARLVGRTGFTWPGDELAVGLTPLGPEQLQLLAKGKVFYAQCAACHGASGAGIPQLAPPLAGSNWVTGSPEWLGRIILQGLNGPLEIAGEKWNGVMPPHGHLAELDDATLAGLMTHLRRSWGNKADLVSLEEAASIRTESAGRTKPWTVAELESVPFDRGFARFVGQYSISLVTMTITEEPEGLHLSVPLYGSGVMTQLSDTLFSAAAGGENVKLEFVVESDGTVRKFILHREGEEIPFARQ